MILPIDIRPEKSLYVIGANIISLFNDENIGVIDILLLYQKFSENSEAKISFEYFLYALDWLFLLNLVKLNENINTSIERCF
jgi:hypothetical protein